MHLESSAEGMALQRSEACPHHGLSSTESPAGCEYLHRPLRDTIHPLHMKDPGVPPSERLPRLLHSTPRGLTTFLAISIWIMCTTEGTSMPLPEDHGTATRIVYHQDPC